MVGTEASRRNWEFLHVCIDDASRVSYAEVLSAETAEACTGFLQRALSVAPGHTGGCKDGAAG